MNERKNYFTIKDIQKNILQIILSKQLLLVIFGAN